MIYLAILLAVVIVAALVFFFRGRSPGKAGALRSRYRQLMFLSQQEADKSLQHQLDAARKKYPGRSEEWYLEKVVYDLERDRR